MSAFGTLPVRRVSRNPEATVDETQWPASLPAAAQLLRDGLDLAQATVLVGENGSGKSTLVEAIALAYGMSAEGGSTGAQHSTRETESGLWQDLLLTRNAGAARWGFFLRAETMHGFYSYLERNPGARPDPAFHEMSHGESFVEVLADRFTSPGLYVLDEPESALSFAGCLALIGVLHELTTDGRSQVLVATHSPLVAAMPGARILELGDWGMRDAAWDELSLVRDWRAFLDRPEAYLRHVV